jgi:hypothetical protein
MKKVYPIIIFFSLILSSCLNEQEKMKYENELAHLKTENEILQQKLQHQNEANKLLRTELDKYAAKGNDNVSPNTDYFNSQIASTLDSLYQEDTLDLAEYGYEYIFKRTNKIVELKDASLANTLGAIDGILKAPGIQVFTIYNGESLPLEYCNKTGNIYIVYEPDNLNEDYSIFSIFTYNQPELLEIERIMSGYETIDYVLKFEHGKYPRKTEQISLQTLKFLKHNYGS